MLVIVLITKFLAGAWITILAMVIFFMIMNGIRRHYDNVGAELAADEDDKVLPTRVHAIVLVSKLHKPTLRALAFAKATRPNVLEGVYVATDAERHQPAAGGVGRAQHRRAAQGAALAVPRDDPADRRLRHARSATANPRGVVAVYIPEYVVGRWWEQLLHNQTALRLKGRLLFTPGRDGDLGALPAALLGDRRASARERASTGCAPATCAAAEVDRRSDGRDATAAESRSADRRSAGAAGAVPGRGAVRGRGRAGRARRALRRPAARHRGPGRSSSSGTRSPASGSSSRSPRAPRATGSGAATPSRCSRPSPDRVDAAVPVRRARAGAAAATSSTSRSPAQRR